MQQGMITGVSGIGKAHGERKPWRCIRERRQTAAYWRSQPTAACLCPGLRCLTFAARLQRHRQALPNTNPARHALRLTRHRTQTPARPDRKSVV